MNEQSAGTDKVKKQKTGRNEILDIIKGIGILLVVAGHCYAPGIQFYLLFHMAVFYIASGYGFKESHSMGELRAFVVRKLRSLWLPFAFWTVLFVLLHNVFLSLSVYTDNPEFLVVYHGAYAVLESKWTWQTILLESLKGLFFFGGTQMSGALWFLRSLFFVSISYACIDYILSKLLSGRKKQIVQTIISVMFLVIGYCFQGKSIGCLTHIFSYYYLYHFGYILRSGAYYERPFHKKNTVIALKLIVSAVILFFASKFGSIGLDRNDYTNPLFFIIVSICGFSFLYACASALEKVAFAKNAFVYIGRRTLPILILHFLAFKLVNAVGVGWLGDPKCLIAAYPVAYTGGAWWIAYMAAGTLLPLLFYGIWKYFSTLRFHNA